MKSFTSSLTINRLLQTAIATTIAFFLSSLILASAQTQQVRKYATRQMTKIGGIVLTSSSTLPLAVDTDPLTSANLTIGVGALGSYIEQLIDFNPSPSANAAYTTLVPGNTPITVKFTLPAGLVAALGGLEIQAIKDLSRNGFGVVSYENVGAAYTGTSLVSLISGTGEVDVTIVPSADYQGVRVRIKSGVLAAGYGVDIFGAYIKENASGDIACSNRLDRLSGVTSNDVANLASGLGSVQNPGDALDASDATFAQLNMGTEVLNATYLTAIFNSKSKVNDSIRIVLQNSTPSVLTLSLLNSFSIRLYDGNTVVKTITNTSSILNLNLLSGGTQTYALTAEVDVAFDRIQVLYGGVASLLNSLKIYDINRKVGSPIRTAAQKNIFVYAGQPATLSATPAATGDVITWYDAATAGALVSNPVSTTTAQSNTVQMYYANVARSGCNDNFDRAVVNVNVVGVTYATPVAGSFGVSYSGSIAATPGLTLPITPSYNYTLVGSLPPGLSLNPATGAITGTPTLPGIFTFSVTTYDQANTLTVGTNSYTISIEGVQPDLVPIIVMNNRGFIKPSNLTRSGSIRLYNITPNSNTIGSITLYIYPPTAGFTMTLTGTSASQWTLTYNTNSNYYTLVSNGLTIPYSTTSFANIMFSITAAPTVSNGIYNTQFEVAENAGGESNNSNNTKNVNLTVSN